MGGLHLHGLSGLQQPTNSNGTLGCVGEVEGLKVGEVDGGLGSW